MAEWNDQIDIETDVDGGSLCDRSAIDDATRNSSFEFLPDRGFDSPPLLPVQVHFSPDAVHRIGGEASLQILFVWVLHIIEVEHLTIELFAA